jgi:hypothetical protein
MDIENLLKSLKEHNETGCNSRKNKQDLKMLLKLMEKKTPSNNKICAIRKMHQSASPPNGG